MPEYLGREETITQNSTVQQIVSLQKATADKLRIKLQVYSYIVWEH